MNTKNTKSLFALVAITALALSAFAPYSGTGEEVATAEFDSSVAYQVSDCAADDFMDVEAHPANSAYPEPYLEVSCDGTTVTIQTNNIPNFEFVATTPNALSAQDYTISIPQNPIVTGETTDVPLGGISAVAVNGIVIFGPTESAQHGYSDPYLDQLLDFCNGHTAPGGVYHYHANPECLSTSMGSGLGTVIAYALDGFPIIYTGYSYESSWQVTDTSASNAWEQHSYVAGSGDLDECNGMYLDDGSYAYVATESFPYFMGCYVGEAATVGLGGGGGGQQAGGAQGGASFGQTQAGDQAQTGGFFSNTFGEDGFFSNLFGGNNADQNQGAGATGQQGPPAGGPGAGGGRPAGGPGGGGGNGPQGGGQPNP